MSALIRTFALVACAAVLAVPAFAGGDDYDAMNDTEGKGPAYFGFVRDTRGSPVSDAQVILRPKKGEPVTLKSNVLGLYRSHRQQGRPARRRRSLLRQDRLQAVRRVAPRPAPTRTCTSRPTARCSGCSRDVSQGVSGERSETRDPAF